MLMADTFAIVFSVLGFLLALQGLWLLCYGLWPQRVQAAVAGVRDHRIRSTIAGIGVTLVTIAVVAVVGGAGGAGQAVAFALASIWVLYAGIGAAALALTIGQRLGEGASGPPWRTLVRGGIAMNLAFLLPIVGWFILLPLSFVMGSGAVTLSLIRRRHVSAPPPEHQPPALPRIEPRLGQRQPAEVLS